MTPSRYPILNLQTIRSKIRLLLYATVLIVITAIPSGGGPIRAYATGETVTLVGAGDISKCSNDNDAKTARLLDSIPGTVFTTGDNVYTSGTYSEFMNCYNSTWGRHKSRTMPVPGNHEYITPRAEGYYSYFGVPRYYAYDRGEWRIYALNSEINTSATSRQVVWLKADLAQNPRKCVMAYWHRPRWSSGKAHGSDPKTQELWNALVDAKAELVIAGHEHNYERFAPMNKTGQLDRSGVREIIVGTGGASHYGFGTILPTSRVRNGDTYGVLKLTLRPDGYDWNFIPVAGKTFTDRGSTLCQ